MKKKQNISHRNNILGYLFLSPWLIGFLLFTFGPFLYTFYLSFTSVKASTIGYTIKPIGFENYKAIFFPEDTPEFFPSMVNFVIMQVLYVPVILVISFILGLLLNQKIKFRSAFRTIFFLPVIILSGAVMQKFFDARVTSLSGISDILIFKIIANYSPFIADAIMTLFNNFTMVLWFTGIPIILFINSLQKIDRQLFEAAQIDGANWWQILWKITIPNIKTTAMIVCIYSIINLGLYNINARNNGIRSIYEIINTTLTDTTSSLGIASAQAAMYSIVVLLLVLIVLIIFRERKQKKFESLQERQLKNLHRIQQRNRRNNMTVKQYFSQLTAKIFKKGGVSNGK